MPTSVTLRANMARLALCALIGLSLSANAKDDAPQPPIPAEWPDFLKKAMKSEIKLKGSTPLNFGDSGITAATPGTVTIEPRLGDNAWFFSADIGEDQTMQCWIFDVEIGMSGTLKDVHEAVIGELAQEMDKSVKKLPYYVHSDVHNGSVMMTSEWFFLLGEEVPEAGMSKIRIAQKDGSTLMCSALGLGYRKTFAQYFEGVLDSLAAPDDAKPYYSETFRLSIGERRAGVAAATFTLNDDGTTRASLITSMLLQIDGNSILTSDSDHMSFSRPDGTLIRSYETVTENGTVKTDLALEKNDDDIWRVSGPFNGKDIDITIDDDTTPISPLGQMILARDTIAAKNKSLVPFPIWVPQADPSSFMEGTLQVEKFSRRGNKAVLTTGPISMNVVLDKTGSSSEVAVAAGPNTILMERMSVAGQLPASTGE